jgi:hypothetical protein
VPVAPTPACPTPGPGGGLGLPEETAPARPPLFGPPEPGVAAVPLVTDGAVTDRAPVVPAIALVLDELVAPSASELQADKTQPNVSTVHRVARLGVFSLDITNCIRRRGLVFWHWRDSIDQNALT